MNLQTSNHAPAGPVHRHELSQHTDADVVVKERAARLMRQVGAEASALYPLAVGDALVEATIEEVTRAASERLNTMLGAEFPEVAGISSNFEGLLADHIRAMLCGQEHAGKRYATPLKPLLVRWDTFGRCSEPAGLQGVTIMRPALEVGAPDLYLCDNRLVPLGKLNAGDLFTSPEAAVDGYTSFLRGRDESPQSHPARLVVVDFSGDELIPLGV